MSINVTAVLLTVKQCHEAKIEPIARARKELVFGRVPLQKGGVRLASAVGASGENSALFRVLQVRKRLQMLSKLQKRAPKQS